MFIVMHIDHDDSDATAYGPFATREAAEAAITAIRIAFFDANPKADANDHTFRVDLLSLTP